MTQTLAVGPLAVPVSLIVLAIALSAGWWSGERLARGTSLRMEPALYLLLGCGLVGARLAFVVADREAYAQSPLSILDVRDGGWAPVAGFGSAALVALLLGAQRVAWRKPLAAALGVTASLWAAGVAATSLLQPASTPMPAVTLSSLDGAPVTLSKFQGKPVVINLWASWCPPCRREMPVLQQAQQRHPDVEFVFLNQGEPATAVHRFLVASQLSLRNVLLDVHGLAGSQLGGRALPSTFVFDERGRLVARRVGALSPATLVELLEGLHRPTPPDEPNEP